MRRWRIGRDVALANPLPAACLSVLAPQRQRAMVAITQYSELVGEQCASAERIE
jgi:hypothetical protein